MQTSNGATGSSMRASGTKPNGGRSFRVLEVLWSSLEETAIHIVRLKKHGLFQLFEIV